MHFLLNLSCYVEMFDSLYIPRTSLQIAMCFNHQLQHYKRHEKFGTNSWWLTRGEWAVRSLIVLNIDFIVYISLITYRLWSHMLRFVHHKIKLYNVLECRLHLSEASPIGCVHCTERALYFVNVLRLSWTTRCLDALRRLWYMYYTLWW